MTLYKTLVQSVVLYNTETWTLKEEEYWHYECVGHRRRRSRAASETETNIFWTRFSYAGGEIPTHPPSWTHLRKSTSGKTKEEMDRQRQGGLQLTGVDAHWSRQSCTGLTSMAEHRTQFKLSARENYIFVAFVECGICPIANTINELFL